MPHSTYQPDRMGTATLSPADPVEAGSFQSFTLVYTAGYFGIDDTGSIKIVQRFAGDMGRPQFTDPKAANYTTVEASNGALLEVRFEPKMNIRPWDKTLFIRVVRGFLNEGDTLTVRFGDSRKGSPGMRMQTFVESTFEFRVLADPFATYNYVELPKQPTFPVVAGPAVLWKAVLPTLRQCGESFRLGFKGEDKWGNPSDQIEGTFALRANLAVAGLPATFCVRHGTAATSIEGLSVAEPGDLLIDVLDPKGRVLCQSNPLRLAPDAPLRSYWCDLHGLGGDHRHQFGARADRVRPQQGLPRRHEPPGQRLPDHHAVLERAERPHARIQQGWPFHHLPGIRMVGQHRPGRRPQRDVHARGPADPSVVARPGRRSGRRLERRQQRRDPLPGAAGRGLRRVRPYRRALRRHQDGA